MGWVDCSARGGTPSPFLQQAGERVWAGEQVGEWAGGLGLGMGRWASVGRWASIGRWASGPASEHGLVSEWVGERVGERAGKLAWAGEWAR